MALKDAVRKIYLYLFSIVGLVLLIIGCVSFLNMGLKAFVFTQADEEMRLNFDRPVEKPRFIESETVKVEGEVQLTLTESEKAQLQFIFDENERWREKHETIDIVSVNRQQDAATNLALIIVGLPLYLYHWLTIRKEIKV